MTDTTKFEGTADPIQCYGSNNTAWFIARNKLEKRNKKSVFNLLKWDNELTSNLINLNAGKMKHSFFLSNLSEILGN